MFLYDDIHNIIHNVESMKPECGIKNTDKPHCSLIDNLEESNKMGFLTHLENPKRCPHCTKNFD